MKIITRQVSAFGASFREIKITPVQGTQMTAEPEPRPRRLQASRPLGQFRFDAPMTRSAAGEAAEHSPRKEVWNFSKRWRLHKFEGRTGPIGHIEWVWTSSKVPNGDSHPAVRRQHRRIPNQ